MSNETKDDRCLVHGRPDRRSVRDHQQVVLELLSGKKSANQPARQCGVKPEAIEAWRGALLVGSGMPQARRDRGETPVTFPYRRPPECLDEGGQHKTPARPRRGCTKSNNGGSDR